MSQLRFVGIVVFAVAVAAGCNFQDSIVSIEWPKAPSAAFQGTTTDAETDLTPIPTAVSEAGAGFSDLTSEQAVDLCKAREFFGDENIGTCLAPGGDAYYVWISPNEVIVVQRDSPFLQSFQIAALSREMELSTVRSKAGQWPKLAPLFFSAGAASWMCGATLASVVSLVAAPTSPWWASGCVASLVSFGVSAKFIQDDAVSGVRAYVEAAKRGADARYNYCRMEGGSDEQCTEIIEDR